MTFLLASTALAQIGPIARAGDLRARGVTRREIARAAEVGEIRRVRRGVYASIHADDSWIHAAEHGGVPCCVTAGRMLGLWILEDVDDPHLWFGHAGNQRPCERPECEQRLHWDDGESALGELPPVRNVLLQIAMCAAEETFFCALESALRTQVMIDGVGEVDMVIGEFLILEADGKQNHDDETADPTRPQMSKRHKDLMRDARAAALGSETLRFDYAMIVHDWPTVVAAILQRSAVHRPRVPDH